MKISVITVAFNAAATIEDTLQSVGSQSHPDIEHVVVDGASTDGTMAIVERYRDRIAKISSGSDRGMYDAMNKGLALATGEMVGFLNADDVFSDATVLSDVAVACADPDVGACYGDLIYVRRDHPERVIRRWRSQPYVDGLFERGWMPAHPTFYARKSAYDRFGGFDLAYRRQSDFELTMRFLVVHHLRSVYLPRVMVRMRSGGASQGLWHILEGNLEAYRACRRHGLKVSPMFVAKKVLSRVPQFFDRSVQ